MINQVSGVGQQYRANSTSFGMALKCGKGFTKGLKDLTADEIQILKKNIDDLAYRSDHADAHNGESNFDVLLKGDSPISSFFKKLQKLPQQITAEITPKDAQKSLSIKVPLKTLAGEPEKDGFSVPIVLDIQTRANEYAAKVAKKNAAESTLRDIATKYEEK